MVFCEWLLSLNNLYHFYFVMGNEIHSELYPVFILQLPLAPFLR